MKLIDISPLISPQLDVWPGDTAFSRQVLLDLNNGDNLTLSNIQSTVHLGAHADAPNHYHAAGRDIASQPLDLYFGPCQVIEVDLPRNSRIMPSDLPIGIEAPRILFKTQSFPDPQNWNNDFNALSPELVHHLAECGVKLVGIDTPSIDPQDDKDLPAHTVVAQHDLAILEGLVLNEVTPGTYTLCALPLKIADADASPVRAVLIVNP